MSSLPAASRPARSRTARWPRSTTRSASCRPPIDAAAMTDRFADPLPTRDIGVAVNTPEPFGSELQGWRERLGDPNASRIVPHVTLLPPTQVATESLAEIEEH